uniref:Uncharacterized protein n=1 Tax=Plectus sambesii TaxID=2011161 RepID=A0A914V864_9BILA
MTLCVTVQCVRALTYLEFQGTEKYPDLVFTANAAVVRGKRAYLANFFHLERKGERFYYDRWFKQNGYETTGSQDIAFEGAGDGLWAGHGDDRLFSGVGPRTDVRVLEKLAFELKDGRPFKVIGCRLIDPRFYHIDTCFCPVGPELALYYPHAFDAITVHNLKNEIELIPVSEREASKFACNSVAVGKNVVMPAGNDETAKALTDRGYN